MYVIFFSLLFRLEEDIFQYAKQNLAVVNVYIKDPVVTRILRDEKIPVIAFVANTGGKEFRRSCNVYCLAFSLLLFIMETLTKSWKKPQKGPHEKLEKNLTWPWGTKATLTKKLEKNLTRGEQKKLKAQS